MNSKRVFAILVVQILVVLACSIIPGEGRSQDQSDLSEENYVVIPDTTHVLNAQAASSLVEIRNGGEILVFESPPDEISVIERNGVIVLPPTDEAPGGLLRKVVAVSTSGNQIQFETTQATLADAIEEGHIHHKQDLDPNDFLLTISEASGDPNKLAAPLKIDGGFVFEQVFNNVVLLDLDGVPATTNDQVTSNIDFKFSVDFEFDIKIKNFELQSFEFSHNGFEQLTFEVITKMHTPVAVGGFSELASWKSRNPITVIVMGFPIFIMPEVNLIASWTVDGGVELSTTAVQSIDYGMSASFDGFSWSHDESLDNSISVTQPDFEGDGKLKLSLGPELVLLFYMLTGPTAGVSYFIEGEINTTQPTCWKIDGGIEGDIGVQVEIFDRNLVSIGFQVFEANRRTFLEADGPCQPAATSTPEFTNTPANTPTLTPTHTLEPTKTPKVASLTATVDVFCREGPGMEFEDDGVLYKNQSARILAQWEDYNWMLVDLDGYYGKTCCWIGNYYTLSVSQSTIPVIDYGVDPVTCDITKPVPLPIANNTLDTVTVSRKNITISVRDNALVDGDRIRLTLNGEVLLDDYTLTGNYYSIQVELSSGANQLVLTALNEGSEPPNTVEIQISDVVSGSVSQIAQGLSAGKSYLTIIAP